MYGEFATFLVTCYEKTGLPGLQSIMNYMSAFKQSLVRDVFDGKERFFGEGIWYSQIRTTTLKRIVGISIDLGRRLVNSPDEIDEFILNELCRHFLGIDECQQKYGIMIRAFFVDTWNLLGRATEIATSTVGSHGFDSVNGCLMLRIKRSKTATSVRNVETVHSVFAGYREWATCALHAKACYLLLSYIEVDQHNPQAFIYPSLAKLAVSRKRASTSRSKRAKPRSKVDSEGGNDSSDDDEEEGMDEVDEEADAAPAPAGVPAFLNRVLKQWVKENDIYEGLKLTSHSHRHGSASHIDSCPG